MQKKKHEQLGIHYSTASGRLIKDILFAKIVSSNNTCFHCGKPMTRENFSIEHKVPWLDSSNPKELFYDLDNISYSHLKCNVKAARKVNKLYNTKEEKNKAYANQQKAKWHKLSKEEQQKIRREKYLRWGK